MTVSTMDPVSMPEIAERLGVAQNTVAGWRTRDVLPPPDWVCGKTPIWAWESLVQHPAVREMLEGADSSAVLDALPRRERMLGWALFDGKREWEVAQKRWDRHGCGYVSVPVADGEKGRVAVTDASEEGLMSVTFAEAWQKLQIALDGSSGLRASGDWRKPIVSSVWQ